MIKKLIFITLLIFSLIGNCYAANISNADIDDEDMADITDWTDSDAGNGVSSQATFDSKSTMKLETGALTGIANRNQDIGTFGTRTVFSMNSYFDAIGARGSNDDSDFQAHDGTTRATIQFCSDGLWIYSDAGGGTWTEVGTDLVVQDVWQEWTFDVDWTAKTVDVYLNQELKGSDADCNVGSATANGTVRFEQYGYTIANRITYVDWFKAGSDFTPEVAAPAGQLIWLD